MSWDFDAEGGQNKQSKACGFRAFCFSEGSKLIFLRMAGFHLTEMGFHPTELKFSCDMRVSTLLPLFEGILMKNSSIRLSFSKPFRMTHGGGDVFKL